MCRNHAGTEIVHGDHNRRLAASLLPERIHPSWRRWPLDETPWRSGGTVDKPGSEAAFSAFDAHRAGAAGPVPEEVGGRTTMTHALDPQLLERPIRVLVVGCGGNGSAIVSGLPYLHQAM